jgi:ATP-dependent Zn protease
VHHRVKTRFVTRIVRSGWLDAGGECCWIPLFAARWVALVALVLNLNVAFSVLKRLQPAAKTWDGTFIVLWWICMGGLVYWAFRALWPRQRGVAQTSAMTATAQPVDSNWSSVPPTRFADVGGFEQLKKEVEVVAKNRFQQKSAGIARNGILLHGPQGTGKNLVAEATPASFAPTSTTYGVPS